MRSSYGPIFLWDIKEEIIQYKHLIYLTIEEEEGGNYENSAIGLELY